jgi:DNA polymerase elongation subunit (family B)
MILTVRCYQSDYYPANEEVDEARYIFFTTETNTNKTRVFNVTGYKMKIYMKLQSSYKGDSVDWQGESKENLHRSLENSILEVLDNPAEYDIDIETWKTSHGYQPEPGSYATIAHHSKEKLQLAMRTIKREFINNEIFLEDPEWYNVQFDPMMLLFNDNNWQRSGFYDVDIGDTVIVDGDDPITVDISKIKMIPKKQWNSLTTKPTMCYFDLETYSGDRVSFPDCYKHTDVIYNCSMSFYHYDEMDAIQKYCICIGNPYNRMDSGKKGPSGSRLDDAKLVIVHDEDELIAEWFNLLKKHKPNYLLGHNILNFDLRYIDIRLALRGNDVPNISMLNGVETRFSDISGPKSKEMRIITSPGMVVLDTMLYFIMMYPNLPSHSLKYVTNHFMKDVKNGTKIDLKYVDQFNAFHAFVNKTHYDVEYIKVIEYCIQDADVLHKLVMNRKVLEVYIPFSNILNINIQAVPTQGKVYQLRPYLYKYYTRRRYLLDVQEQAGGESKINGALVTPPVQGPHENVSVSDYTSLYPAIIISENLCTTSHVTDRHTKKYEHLPHHIIKTSYKTSNKKDFHNDEDAIDIVDSDAEEETKYEKEDRELEEMIYEKKTKKSDKKGKVSLNTALNRAKNAVEEGCEMKEIEKKIMFVDKSVTKGVIPQALEDLTKERKVAKEECKSYLRKACKNLNNVVKYAKTNNIVLPDIDMDNYTAHELAELIEDPSLNYCEKLRTEYFAQGPQEVLDDLNKCEFNYMTSVDRDREQAVIKVVANSIYGIMGSKASYADKFVAMATTAYGQKFITEATDVIVNRYNATHIYTDTDSSMYTSPGLQNINTAPLVRTLELDINVDEDLNKSISSMGFDINSFIDEQNRSYTQIIKEHTLFIIENLCVEMSSLPDKSGIYKPPMKFEWEAFMIYSFFITKKKYIATIINEKGNRSSKERGIILRRGDCADIVKSTYRTLIYSALHKASTRSIMNRFYQDILDIVEEVDFDKFSVGTKFKTLSSYKSSGAKMATAAVHAASLGFAFQDNSQIYNVMVVPWNEESRTKNSLCVCTKEMMNKLKATIDNMHYVKFLSLHSDTIINIIYKGKIKDLLVDSNGELTEVIGDKKCKKCKAPMYVTKDIKYCCAKCVEKKKRPSKHKSMIWSLDAPTSSYVKLSKKYCEELAKNVFKTTLRYYDD